MTSRFRGSKKIELEKPKPTAVISSRVDGSLDSSRGVKGKHSWFEESRGERAHARSEKLMANCFYMPEDEKLEDADLVYRRSREHFGTWDIKDILGDCNNLTPEAKTKDGRKSRFELFRSAPTDGKNKITRMINGENKTKVGQERRSSPAKASRSQDHVENDESPSSAKTRFSPFANANGNDSEEKMKMEKKKKKKKRMMMLMKRNKETQETEDAKEHQTYSDKAKSRESENSDSPRRGVHEQSAHRHREERFRKSRSASRDNETIRSTFEKFKDKEKDSQEDIRSFSLDRTFNRREAESCPPLARKDSEEHKNANRAHRSKESSRPKEVIEIKNESSRKRSDAHNFGPLVSSRNSRGVTRKKDDSFLVDEPESPDEFNVRIKRYERALAGPRRDPESLPMRHSSRQARVSSVSELDGGAAHSLQKKLPRHARALTPPREPGSEDHEDDTRKDWHESNREFARRYLKEEKKFGNGASEERHSAGGSADKGFRNKYFAGTSLERKESPADQTQLRRPTVVRQDPLDNVGVLASDERYRQASTGPAERNVTATFIQIPDSSRNPSIVAKRWAHGSFGTNGGKCDVVCTSRESRNSKRPSRTPSRKIWEYQDGGVRITDINNGQPCLQCEGACSGFVPHPWRKNCTSCKCPREAHDVCHEEWVSVRARLGLKADSSGGGPVPFDPRDRGLVWAPPGLPSHKVEEYFSMLPEIMVPRLGSPGERYRDRQLAIQLPKQDLARAYCRHLEPQHSTSADDFMAARNEIALDIGTVQEITERCLECGGCHNPLNYGTLAVSASKLGLLYHPPCFQCTQCRELLVDLAYCVHDDALYCERHYAEQLKPRCAACDESETMADVDSVVYTTTERKVRKVKKTTKRRESHDQNAEVTITEVDSTQNNHNAIEDGEYTKAMNKDWHSGHFCCWQCDESLTGQRYVLRDEHPYCIKCYESVFANGCEECNKIIGIDSKDLSYKDKHWHEACFLCNKCRVSLVDKQFGSKLDKIYCGNCYDAQFASRCDGCGEIFRAGTKKMEYKTRQWHEKCFCCVVCKNPIGTKSFIPREQEIYCAGCYEDKFATRCVKCNKIITSGGVTYKNEPWHRDCFTCSNCSTSLAGQRFTSRDEKPYCADCFGELFAKRCTACTKPITGIGGTRFISFEDRHWHNDCFICAGCRTSLVGRGFITDGDDIICPECAKQKLM